MGISVYDDGSQYIFPNNYIAFGIYVEPVTIPQYTQNQSELHKSWIEEHSDYTFKGKPIIGHGIPYGTVITAVGSEPQVLNNLNTYWTLKPSWIMTSNPINMTWTPGNTNFTNSGTSYPNKDNNPSFLNIIPAKYIGAYSSSNICSANGSDGGLNPQGISLGEQYENEDFANLNKMDKYIIGAYTNGNDQISTWATTNLTTLVQEIDCEIEWPPWDPEILSNRSCIGKIGCGQNFGYRRYAKIKTPPQHGGIGCGRLVEFRPCKFDCSPTPAVGVYRPGDGFDHFLRVYNNTAIGSRILSPSGDSTNKPNTNYNLTLPLVGGTCGVYDATNKTCSNPEFNLKFAKIWII
jgi:hypothetical protein